MPVQIAILEDHRSFSEALSMALEATGQFRCIGSASTVEALQPVLANGAVDIVVLDYQLIGPDGISSAAVVREHGFDGAFMMLTAHASPDLARRAREAGIDVVLAKESPLDEVLDALHGLAAGDTAAATMAPDDVVSLSARQREVLALMGDGLDPREIADRLFISIHTARGHVKDVMRHMRAGSQLEAVTNAIRSGYLVIPRRVR